MKKIAFVICRYGAEIKDGTEYYCKLMIEQLKSEYEIDVVTTCALDKTSWINYYKPGFECENGINIYRFQTTPNKNVRQMEKINSLLENEHNYEDEVVCLHEIGPYCPELFEYIHGNYCKYKAVIFVSYMFYTTSMCMLGVPNALLMPIACDEAVIHLLHFQRVFLEHNGFIFISSEEKEFVDKLFHTNNLTHVVCEFGENPASTNEKQWDVIKQKLKNIMDFVPNVEKNIICSYKKEYGLYHEIRPVYGENSIAIAFASDDRYVPVLSVAIQAVLNRAVSHNNYDIIVLSDGISIRHRKLLLSMIEERKNISIRFLEVGYLLDQYIFQFTNIQLSRATFLRFFLPDTMKNYDRILYLDGDIVLMRGIEELFYVDLKDNLVAAVEDSYVSVMRKITPNIERHLQEDVGLDSDEKYFNAGVLLINLNEFRKQYSVKYMCDMAAERKWIWEDQDVLNKLCRKKVFWLSKAWNVLWTRNKNLHELMMTNDEYFRSFNNPSILHYASGVIPIKQPDGIFAEKFWEVAKESPFYEVLLIQMCQTQIQSVNVKKKIYKHVWQRKINSAIVCLKENGMRYTCKIFIYNLVGILKYGFKNDEAMTVFLESKKNNNGLL